MDERGEDVWKSLMRLIIIHASMMNDVWKSHVERETDCVIAMDIAWLLMIYGIIFLSSMQECYDAFYFDV